MLSEELTSYDDSNDNLILNNTSFEDEEEINNSQLNERDQELERQMLDIRRILTAVELDKRKADEWQVSSGSSNFWILDCAIWISRRSPKARRFFLFEFPKNPFSVSKPEKRGKLGEFGVRNALPVLPNRFFSGGNFWLVKSRLFLPLNRKL